MINISHVYFISNKLKVKHTQEIDIGLSLNFNE